MTTSPASETLISPTAIHFGLIGGLISIAWFVIKDISGLDPNPLTNVLDIAIFGFVVHSAIKSVRELQDDSISYKNAIGVGVMACAIVGLITGLFSCLYFYLVDSSDLNELLTKKLKLNEGEGYQDFAKKMIVCLFIFRHVFGGLWNGMFYGFVCSLLMGAIMEKEPPV